jgi:hypothetical protein
MGILEGNFGKEWKFPYFDYPHYDEGKQLTNYGCHIYVTLYM